jgi:hypothetical protein
MKASSMKSSVLSVLLVCLFTVPAWSADFRVEPLAEAPPIVELNKEIAGKLKSEGVRVIRGTKTTFCDIWLCKKWDAPADFKATPEVLYPFKVGQLIGVVRFGRKGADFRDQDIGKGVYTIRYAQQPVDGSHVGTSPTRDFLLLIRAEDEDTAAPTNRDDLVTRSSDAAESSHPCMLSLQRLAAKKFPSMRHTDETDWWILALQGTVGKKVLPIEFVISGVAAE